MQQWLYLGYQIGQCCSVSLHMLGASPLNSKLYSLLNIIQQTSDFRNLFPRGQNLLLLYSQSQWGTETLDPPVLFPWLHFYCHNSKGGSQPGSDWGWGRAGSWWNVSCSWSGRRSHWRVDPCQQTPGPAKETLIFQPRYDCLPAQIIKLWLFWSSHSSLFLLASIRHHNSKIKHYIVQILIFHF